jgi:hypothetical protein
VSDARPLLSESLDGWNAQKSFDPPLLLLIDQGPNGGGVTSRVLQHGEVAYTRQDHELAPWYSRGYRLGVIALDCLIVFTKYDRGWYFDRCELFLRPVRCVSHMWLICLTKASYWSGVLDSFL